MPSISFELPHWVFWSVLVLFPLIAMVMARRDRARGYSLPVAYLIWATGGMLGLHRLYLRNFWGLLYLPLFVAILIANAEGRDARSVQSDAANVVRSAESSAIRARDRLLGADARLAQLEAQVETAEPDSFSRMRAERALERERAALEDWSERLAEAEERLETARPTLEEASAARRFWNETAKWLLYVILAALVVDAALLPRLTRRAGTMAGDYEPSVVEPDAQARIEALEAERLRGDLRHVGRGWIGAIERLSLYSGEFVSYWAIIAVFVYYFEVVARYVFNSPSNWAHEGMFLMFGMQYLIAGAYAMLTESHVRVDIFYARWSPRGRALVDLVTSIFFFIFAGTLLATGWIFAMDATRVGEISFSEWAIPYWPFKWAIAVGGLLLLLQGIAKMARDVQLLISPRAG
jgi:TRAP-type mannitol/chloroaromatic compound transport system permease small subunit